MPPMYWSTGSQRRTRSGRPSASASCGIEEAQVVPGASRRTCPSCRSRAAPGRRTSGSVVVTNASRLRRAGCPPLPGTRRPSGSRTGRSVVRHRHDAAARSGRRDRRAPVALARDQPVAQAVADLAASRCPLSSSQAMALAIGLGRWSSPSSSPRASDRRRGGIASVSASPAVSVRRGGTTGRIGRPYLARELEVALVVRREPP